MGDSNQEKKIGTEQCMKLQVIAWQIMNEMIGFWRMLWSFIVH